MNTQGAWSVAGMPESDAATARQRPYWLIGLAVLAGVLLVLGAAFLLDQRFRPRVGTEPASGTTEQRVTVPSKTISSESEIGQLATPLEREVATAYLRYWTVYGAAMETLDSSALADVAQGNRLQEARADVDELRAEGVTAKFQVRHSFRVSRATQDEATVQDEYVNTSFAVDPLTGQPLSGPGGSQQARNTYYLRKMSGTWKVVDAKKGWD